MTLLFKELEAEEPQIKGLRYLPYFISTEEEQNLLKQIDQQNWITDLKRRVQHYGYRYDYKARTISKDLYLGFLPEWLDGIIQKLCDDGIFIQKPDQVIVNEYLPGQGISPHIDCIPCFGNVIASLSLGSGAVMQFDKDNERESLYLEPCSLAILSDEARHKWKHSIPARKSDTVEEQKILRKRRVSLTFRTIKRQEKLDS